jgi:hypothetical protein
MILSCDYAFIRFSMLLCYCQDELDPVADYGKRHRIIDEYILFADTACTGPCLNGEWATWGRLSLYAYY